MTRYFLTPEGNVAMPIEPPTHEARLQHDRGWSQWVQVLGPEMHGVKIDYDPANLEPLYTEKEALVLLNGEDDGLCVTEPTEPAEIPLFPPLRRRRARR